jgi:spoIIIJ-associated protein
MDPVETILISLLSKIPKLETKVTKLLEGVQTIYNIETLDARMLIGPEGETARQLDYVVKKIADQEKIENLQFMVDVAGFRLARLKDLQAKVKMMAERARSLKYNVELSPMSSFERLIVHNALQNEPNIQTESQGEGRERHIVIKYRENMEQKTADRLVVQD